MPSAVWPPTGYQCQGPLFPLFRDYQDDHTSANRNVYFTSRCWDYGIPPCLAAYSPGCQPSVANLEHCRAPPKPLSCLQTISTGRGASHYSPNYPWKSRIRYGTSQHGHSLAMGSYIHFSQLIIIASKIQRPYESAVIPCGLALEEP